MSIKVIHVKPHWSCVNGFLFYLLHSWWFSFMGWQCQILAQRLCDRIHGHRVYLHPTLRVVPKRHEPYYFFHHFFAEFNFLVGIKSISSYAGRLEIVSWLLGLRALSSRKKKSFCHGVCTFNTLACFFVIYVDSQLLRMPSVLITTPSSSVPTLHHPLCWFSATVLIIISALSHFTCTPSIPRGLSWYEVES